MKLTRIVALAGMVALAAPAAYAQGGDSIGQAFRAQMPPMQQGTPPDSATRAKGMEVRQKQYAAVRTVLTADQQKVFDKNLEEMRNRPRPQ